MVSLARGAGAREALRSMGYAVEWHEYPMEHSVCMEEVQALQGWLLKVLS